MNSFIAFILGCFCGAVVMALMLGLATANDEKGDKENEKHRD